MRGFVMMLCVCDSLCGACVCVFGVVCLCVLCSVKVNACYFVLPAIYNV